MISRTLPALAAASALALSGCGGMPSNRSLDSVHQPVVEQQSYALDLAAGMGGPGYAEQRRLGEWFDALGLGYGDRVAVDDPSGDPATRETVAALASRRGADLVDSAAMVAGDVLPGTVRVTVNRSRAHVPGCPDWSAKSDTNYGSGTYPNYGCAVNGNLAAMVADPADLVRGASDTGTTVTMTGSKAIASYREAPTTGTRGLNSATSTGASGGGGSGP